MIFDLLQRTANVDPRREFIVSSEKIWTYERTVTEVWNANRALTKAKVERCAFYLHDTPELLCLVLAADTLGAEVTVLNRDFSEEEIKRICSRFQFQALISDQCGHMAGTKGVHLEEVFQAPANNQIGDKIRSHAKSTVGILTTGTTGEPKGAVYGWQDLLAGLSGGTQYQNKRWLLVYPLNHFAGIQVFLHALYHAGTLIMPESKSIPDLFQAIKLHKPNYVSGTPTFWRMLTSMVPATELRGAHIQHITLGGEAVTGDLLDRLGVIFPNARVSQIYATTELGVVFTVRDGRKGFPAVWLEMGVRDIRLRIEEGQLFVRSPRSMKCHLGNEGGGQKDMERDMWYPTGDLVAVEGDRVVFQGRVSEVINVGGRKVHPQEIEEVVLCVPGVLGARAYGAPNPVTGQLVVVEVEPNAGTPVGQLEKAIRTACTRKLAKFKVPRLINFTEKLPTMNQKIIRRGIMDGTR